MTAPTVERAACSIARTLEHIGDAWTLLIIRDLTAGPQRFDELVRSLGIARNVLTSRLRRLEDAGIIAAASYQDNPPRFEYALTRKGQELRSVLVAVLQWGDRWTRGAGDPPPVEMRHAACDHRVSVEVRCTACERAVAPDELRAYRKRRSMPARTRRV